MAERKGLPSLEILEQRGSDEQGGCSGKDKGSFKIRFHPHPTLSLQGRGTLELAPKLLVTDFPHLFVN